MSYNFSTLHDKDLEDLTRDLLTKDLNIKFESFKKGRDKGIDLRYSTEKSHNDIIVQVKHYVGSKYSNLKSDLKIKELPKIKELKPKRYIVVTSLPLNGANKDEIKKILHPFVLNTGDIYGQDELNGLIGKYPEIEENHFKLWLSSTTVLKRILKNGQKGRSEFVASKIISKIKKFVPSKNYEDSVKVLNDRNFILITGAPGIGKTILANMLTYQLLAEGFELVYITDVKEAEDSYSNGKKQVFYFDDFLGATTLDLTSSRNADASLISFIERIKDDSQKRLILTCRTTILNQAKEKSEIIDNSKIEISKHVVKVEDYGKLEKAKILYNHIYHSNLTDEYKSVFFNNQFHWKVINHKNYTPRIVEFFTDFERLQTSVEYSDEIINFLNSPEKIWEKSFTIQLSETARILLSTMFSISGVYSVSESKLKLAFESRIQYEISTNNFRKKGNIFNSTIKELQNAFIHRVINVSKGNLQSEELKFLNPSIEDYLYYYFNNGNVDEYLRVLNASIYLEQFKNRIATSQESWEKKIIFNNSDYNRLLELFIDKLIGLKSYSTNKDLDTILCLITLFKWEDVQDDVINAFCKLNLDNLVWTDKYNLIEILDYFALKGLTKLIPISLNEIFIKITEGYLSIHLFTHYLPKLLKHDVYRENIADMKRTDHHSFKEYKNNIILFWQQNIENYIQSSNVTSADTEDEIEILAKEKIKEIQDLTEQLQVNNFIALRKFKFNSKKQFSQNIESKKAAKTLIENISMKDNTENEINEVNRLFDSNGELPDDDLPF